MFGRVFVLLALCAGAVLAQDADLEQRLERLERELAAEKQRGDAREQRIAELETALDRATQELARGHDRRQLEDDIETYLAERGPAGAAGEPSRLSIGAVIVFSYRFTEFDGPTDSTNTFRLERRYLRLVYRFSDAVTARYYTDGSLAEVEWHKSDLLQVNAGVVVVPFGQFNQRSFSDTFDTLSRPLLYLGDEDVVALPENNPRAVFRSIYSDAGVVVSGNVWRDGNQFYYAGFVTNGLAGVNDLGQGPAGSDNNDSKQFGLRTTYTNRTWFQDTRVGFGLSALTGRYDPSDDLSYRMYGADLLVIFEDAFGEDGSLTFRAEYVYAPREILYPAAGAPGTQVNDAHRVQGAYLLAEARLDRRWMVYAGFDWLARKGPLVTGGTIDPANSSAVTSTIYRAILGVTRRFEVGILWKTEYSYWDFDRGAADAHRFSTQIVIPF